MNTHHHLSSEEIFAAVEAGDLRPEIASCPACRAEAESLAAFFTDLRRADADLVATTEWDDLLLRRRIREAVAEEPRHARSFLDRFFILKPALVSAVAAVLVFAVWSPLAGVRRSGAPASMAASVAESRLPAWSPLPDEADDEGLAVLAEWTPTEDELAVAGCHGACLSGLSLHEENLLHAASSQAPRPPVPGGSPL